MQDPAHAESAPGSRRYDMAPFGPEAWPAALRLLLREYPHSTAAWWEAGMARLRAVPPNDEQRPLGVMMHGPRGVAGVMLLIASRRPADPPGRTRVNGTSWAIEPRARTQVLRMAQACLRPQAITTALTPTPAALRVQRRVGFEPISHQRVLVGTPRLALRKQAGAARVLGGKEALLALKDSPVGRLLDDHLRLGCIVCAIETPDRIWPMVLHKRKQSRVIPLAELIYLESVEVLGSFIVPLSRHLLSLGYPLLEFEAHEDALPDFPCTRLFRRRFAHGPYDNQGIDHLYSELVYLHRGA